MKNGKRYKDISKYGTDPKNEGKKKKKKSKVITIVICSILFVALAITTAFGLVVSKLDRKLLDEFGLASILPSQEEEELPDGYVVDENPEEMKIASGGIISDGKIKNIMLIGRDTRGGGTYGLSDSMMILSIDKKNNELKFTSLLRDMYLKIDGMQDNRINAAFSYGGPKLLIDTVHKNFKVRIDNYVCVNFEDFSNIVDALGGVDINLSKEEATELNVNRGVYFKPTDPMVRYHEGVNHLSGIGAVGYSRIRHIDSDFNRTQRQRTVITTLIDKFKNSGATTMVNFLNKFIPMVQTDLTNAQLMSMALESQKIMNFPIRQFRLPDNGTYESKYIRKMAVLVPDVEKNKEALWKFIYNYEG